MLSAIFDFLYIFPSLLTSLFIFIAYKKGGSLNKQIRVFSLFFLLFSLYRSFLAVFNFTSDLIIGAWSYNIAIIIFYIMIVLVWQISFDLLGLSRTKQNFLLSTMAIVGILVFDIQIYDFRLPIIHSSGLIFWNTTPIAAWITALSGFLVGMTWVYAFLKNLKNTRNRIAKIKSVSIIFTAFMLAVSSLTHFHSQKYYLLIFSFITAFLGFLFFLSAVYISYKYEKTQDNAV